jgi:cytochrome P450
MAVQSGVSQRVLAAVSSSSPVIRGSLIGAFILAIFLIFARRRQNSKLLPTWVPLEIAFTGYMVGMGGTCRAVLSVLRRYGGSLFGLTTRHVVLVRLPGVDTLFTRQAGILDHHALHWSMMTKLCRLPDESRLRDWYTEQSGRLIRPLERLFLNEAASSAALQTAKIHEKAANLVVHPRSMAEVPIWQLFAEAREVSPTAVEADLYTVVSDFAAAVAVPILYGTDLLKRNPKMLADFWLFDHDVFPLRLVGIPEWAPVRSLQRGLEARTRLLAALEGWYTRLDNDDPAVGDASTAARERHAIMTGLSTRERAGLELSIFWGQNANMAPLTFWLIVYLYSQPELVAEIRREIAPHAPTTPGVNGALQLSTLDVVGIYGNCPLLKSCMLEAFRLATRSNSIRLLEKDIEIPEKGLRNHRLPAGTWISVIHAADQLSADTYDKPEAFVADRFLQSSGPDGHRTASYGKLRPWGAGAGMCKGRIFAEKEIMAVAAAILSLWDLESPEGEGHWLIPDMIPGTGVMKPTVAPRVIFSRRNEA